MLDQQGGVTKVQSVLFKHDYGVASAKKWLKKHGYKYGDLDETKQYLRFRQLDTKKLKKSGYSVFRTLKISKDIVFIISILKSTKK